MHDGVPNALCIPSRCFSEYWMPFCLNIYHLNTVTHPTKNCTRYINANPPNHPLAAFSKPLKIDDFQHAFRTIASILHPLLGQRNLQNAQLSPGIS